MSLNFAGVFSFVNNCLRRTGVQLIRVSILEDLHGQRSSLNSLQIRDVAGLEASTSKSRFEERLLALDLRTERSIQDVVRYSMKAHWRLMDFIDELAGSDGAMVCPLCGQVADSNGFRQVVSDCRFFGGRLVRHECPNCEVIFGPQKMLALDKEMLDLDYRNLYRIYSEGNSTESVIRTFRHLCPTKEGVYLDFGCGGEWSEAIERLRGEGWNVYGFEPNAEHSSKFVYSRWEELSGKQFDGIFSHNVLEHLFDPVGVSRPLKNPPPAPASATTI